MIGRHLQWVSENNLLLSCERGRLKMQKKYMTNVFPARFLICTVTVKISPDIGCNIMSWL